MAASAPPFLACFVSSIASSVEFEPVPAITGTPVPLAAAMQMSMTRLCSSVESVGDSPVVAHGPRPSAPSLTGQAPNFSKPFSSTDPFLNGVISATSDPVNMAFPSDSSWINHSRPHPLSRQGEQLAIVMPQLPAYDSWCEKPSLPPPRARCVDRGAIRPCPTGRRHHSARPEQRYIVL